MHKTALLLLALSSTAYAGATYAWAMISNTGGSMDHVFQVPVDQRKCFCVKNVQTATIYSDSESNTRVFSSSDCTGNFQALGEGISNAQWVNSISLGKSGIRSSGPSGCPNWY
ncbi:hypothetical protein BGX24_011861 [Mortierella sp. AD032]|nr:hypothetical protein BGX24_011861 [Mortierella sp. AD032]